MFHVQHKSYVLNVKVDFTLIMHIHVNRFAEMGEDLLYLVMMGIISMEMVVQPYANWKMGIHVKVEAIIVVITANLSIKIRKNFLLH